jgi:glycosyltransferase involved in cell wall biosynthesis
MSLDRALVSIVTPVLNGESTIGLCLASVAAQTHPRVEHIVIDGGSTDGTIDIVRSWAARGRVIKWVSEPDNGMYDAVNRGLAVAQGDVLAYLNSDDAYLPWSAALAAKALSTGHDFAFGDLGVVRLGRKSFVPQFYPAFDLNVYAYFWSLAQPTVFWRRTAYEELGGFDHSYRLIGDCEYWLRAGAAGYSFTHIDEIMAIQFDHGQTLRNTHREQLQREFTRMRDDYRGAVGPPGRWGAFSVALSWRTRMLRFYASAMRRRPTNWRRFISWLHQNEISARPTGLLSLLPSSMWPRAVSFADAARIHERLQATLSSGPLQEVGEPPA